MFFNAVMCRKKVFKKYAVVERKEERKCIWRKETKCIWKKDEWKEEKTKMSLKKERRMYVETDGWIDRIPVFHQSSTYKSLLFPY